MNNLGFRFLVLFALLNLSVAQAQTTTFTYQGQLASSGAPYSGTAEFQATLWNAPTNGLQVAANSPAQITVPVTNGLFTLPLDFGANFPGADRWLQLEVRTTLGAFTPLTPRQKLTPAPYAITAANAGNLTGTLQATQLSGALPSANLSGTYSAAVTLNNAQNSFSGNGGGLTNLNASQLSSGTVPDARLAGNVARTGQLWLLGGNSGTTAGTNFLGTTDAQPLELKVNGQRVFRLENPFPNAHAPNVIGGSHYNIVAAGVTGATIAGGGATNIVGFGLGRSNMVAADFGAIGGGEDNTIREGATGSTIAGGSSGSISTDATTSTIGGGNGNSIASETWDSTIAGGSFNSAGGGGDGDNAGITIGGGSANRAYSVFGTIGGGIGNTISGFGQPTAYAGVIAGGWENEIKNESRLSVIGGGVGNLISTNGDYGVISGGESNNILANAAYAFIAGGRLNSAGDYAFAAGRRAKAIHTGSFVWGDSQNADVSSSAANQFLIRAAGGVGIGTEAPNSQLHVNGDGATPSLRVQVSGASKLTVSPNGGTAIGANTTPPANGLYVVGDVGIGRVPAANSLEVAGDASKTTAGSWLANSDARIKTDVHTITNALQKLAGVRPVEFRYTDEYRAQHPAIKDRPYLNVIAQEFQKVFPDAVKSSGDKLPNGDTILQVDSYPILIYSAAAIQELDGKLKQRDAEITELKQRLESLEKAMSRMR